MAAARSAPESDPANKKFFLPRATALSAPFSDIVFDLEQSVVGVGSPSPPSRGRISNRSRSPALRGQRAKRILHSFAQTIEQWHGSRLAKTQPHVSRVAADLVFNRIESTDPAQRFGGYRWSMRKMALPELALGICPAGCLIDVVAVQMMGTGIGISLQGSREVLQTPAGMFSPAIFRIGEPYSGCGLLASRSVIANIGPEQSGFSLTGFSLTVAGCEKRDGRVIGMELATSNNMLAEGLNQRSDQITDCTDQPAMVEREMSPADSIDLRLPK